MIFARAWASSPTWAGSPTPWRGGPGAVVVLATAAAQMFARFRPQPRRSARPASPFEEVVLGHLDAAYSLARFLARDADAAEDIVQTAVLEAHRGFDGYRGGDAKAWLLAIVRREYMRWSMRRRAGSANLESVDLSELADRLPAEVATPEQALLRQGEVDAVRGAIDALPEPFRETIILRELEELSYREVAQITGTPIGTVMSRLARGRELLARRLRGEAAPQAEAAP
jgi:RNA polymerase sigma-70 factor (ECF subfamily)